MTATAMSDVAEAELDARLRAIVSQFGRTIVAYSGGVDSAVVAEVATSVLGRDDALVAIAVSPSLASYELEDAAALARQQDWRLETIATAEFDDPLYVANRGDRCYFCKTELYTKLAAMASDADYSTIANGANLDDRGDYRPGMRAATDYGVRSPLLEAGIGKTGVRALARRYGLQNWDKPAQPCLSSRVPYGTGVTPDVVARISRAELSLRRLGFAECRVRHYGDRAVVEVPTAEVPRLRTVWADAESGVLDAGYANAEIEERGLKSGRLNEALAVDASAAVAGG